MERSIRSAFVDTIGSCSMLPREDGGVVDNKLKVSAVPLIGRKYLPTHWPVGVRDDEHPGYGHFNYPSSRRCTHARYAIPTMFFFEGTRAYRSRSICSDGICNWRARSVLVVSVQ
jgi:hypothetical protein